MATLKDVVELSINTAPTYEVLQLVDGHVLRVASGQQGRTDLFAIGPESPDLIIGFEVGLLMVRLSGSPSTWRGAFHVVSGPMLERAAKALGYQMTGEPPWADGVWMFCDFVRVGSVQEDAHIQPFTNGTPVTMTDAVVAASNGSVTPAEAEEHIRNVFKALLERVFTGLLQDGIITEEQALKVLTRFTEVIGEMSVQPTIHGEG